MSFDLHEFTRISFLVVKCHRGSCFVRQLIRPVMGRIPTPSVSDQTRPTHHPTRSPLHDYSGRHCTACLDRTTSSLNRQPMRGLMTPRQEITFRHWAVSESLLRSGTNQDRLASGAAASPGCRQGHASSPMQHANIPDPKRREEPSVVGGCRLGSM